MAERRARLPQGWSALTQAHRDALFFQGPILPSFTSEHPAPPDPSQFIPLSSHAPPPNPPRSQSFAGVVKQHVDLATSTKPSDTVHANRTRSLPEIDLSYLHTDAVSRLHGRHPWADFALISDIFETLDCDEERVSALLVSMLNDNVQRVSAVSDAECCFPLQEDDGHNRQAWEVQEAEVGSQSEIAESAKKGYLLECRKLALTEPEWEEDDLYSLSRRDALKMSRASRKHARGAHKAFMSGDYIKARVLSKQAKEEWVEAQTLHAEAAKQILEARNGLASKNLFYLDLHGLHVSEAVAALQHRLQEIEFRIANPRYIQDSCLSLRSIQELNALQGSPLQGFVFNKELKVITGVGNHSHGGGSLPMAIQSLLLQNRYKFEEVRPGVVAVHPKFLASKGNQYGTAELGLGA